MDLLGDGEGVARATGGRGGGGGTPPDQPTSSEMNSPLDSGDISLTFSILMLGSTKLKEDASDEEEPSSLN